ncbi:MAG: hypothetical protein E6G66_09895 [Actinobacteria bacterium]|nr:MAG: hypothetical protein E6G66_09895 [Actinomycetota bacterium]
MEPDPCRRSDHGLDGKTRRAVACNRRRTDLEAEPVAEVTIGRCSEVRFCHVARHLPVHVDIEAASNPQVTRHEGCGAFDDPSVVDNVEALKKPVVCHLALELLKGPGTLHGRLPQALGKGAPKGGGCSVAVFGGHGAPSCAEPSD